MKGIQNISVIGGSGFIGTYLVDLLKDFYTVSILDKKESAKYSDITTIGDIRDYTSFTDSLKDTHTVVLLAAEHRDDVTPTSLYYDVNVEGTKNVLKSMEEHGIQHIVFTSSVAVYGLNKPNPSEVTEVDPFNHYGKSKYMAEEVLKDWHKQDKENRKLTIIRPTVVFGEGNRGNVYNLLKQINSGIFLMVGNGQNKKSMAYVRNIAAFLKYSIEDINSNYEIINYIDKPDLTIRELVTCTRSTLNKKGSLIKLPYFIGLLGGYTFDALAFLTGKKYPVSSIRVKKFCATTEFDAGKLSSYDFEKPYALKKGLKNTLEKEFS